MSFSIRCCLLVLAIYTLIVAPSCSKHEEYSSMRSSGETVPQSVGQNTPKEYPCICTPQTAKTVGELYLASNPLFEADQKKFVTFQTIVEAYSRDLQADSPDIICANELGRALINRALTHFSGREIDAAYGRALSEGATLGEAQKIKDSFANDSVTTDMMGEELVWLSKVLPPAANGNWQPYWDPNSATEQRREYRYAVAMMRSMPTGSEALKSMQGGFAYYRSILVDQTVVAACAFRRK